LEPGKVNRGAGGEVHSGDHVRELALALAVGATLTALVRPAGSCLLMMPSNSTLVATISARRCRVHARTKRAVMTARDIAATSANTYAVADTGNNRVREFGPCSEPGFAGSGGSEARALVHRDDGGYWGANGWESNAAGRRRYGRAPPAGRPQQGKAR